MQFLCQIILVLREGCGQKRKDERPGSNESSSAAGSGSSITSTGLLRVALFGPEKQGSLTTVAKSPLNSKSSEQLTCRLRRWTFHYPLSPRHWLLQWESKKIIALATSPRHVKNTIISLLCLLLQAVTIISIQGKGKILRKPHLHIEYYTCGVGLVFLASCEGWKNFVI